MCEITYFYDGHQHPSMNGDSWREEAACCLVKMQIFQHQQDEHAEKTDEIHQFQLRHPDSMHRRNQVEPQLSWQTGSFKLYT